MGRRVAGREREMGAMVVVGYSKTAASCAVWTIFLASWRGHVKQQHGIRLKIGCFCLVVIPILLTVIVKGLLWGSKVWSDFASKYWSDAATQACKAIIHEMCIALRHIGILVFDARYSFIPIISVFAMILILFYLGEERTEEKKSPKKRTGPVRIMDDSPVTCKEDDELLRGAYVEPKLPNDRPYTEYQTQG